MEKQGLYFIQGFHSYEPAIKVGISNNPAIRMNTLKNEAKIKNINFKLLAFWEPEQPVNIRAHEKGLHLALGNWQKTNWGTEWFDYRAALHVMWWVKLFEPRLKIYHPVIPSPLSKNQIYDMWGMFLDTFLPPDDPRAIALMNALDIEL